MYVRYKQLLNKSRKDDQRNEEDREMNKIKMMRKTFWIDLYS